MERLGIFGYERRRSAMKLASNTGMLLLGIWLVLTAAMQLLRFSMPPEVTSILALAAGVMILMNK
jgi:hypothetical protein